MYHEISMVVSSHPARISSDFAPHMAELVLRERCEQAPLVFLADRELRAVEHLDAVILEPHNGAHVDDDAAVADQKPWIGAKLLFHLREDSRCAAFALVAHDADEVVLRQRVIHLAVRQAHEFAGETHLDFRFGVLQDAQQVIQQLTNARLLERFEQIIERMHRERLPDVLLRGCDENNRQRRRLFAEFPCGVDAVRALHANVEEEGIQLLRADSAKQCVAAFVADDVRLSLGGQHLLKTLGVLREIIDDGDSQQHARTPFYLDDTTAADFLHPPLAQENVRLRKN